MKGIVDRIAGEYVIIEIDGKTQDIPRSLVANHVREGDVVEEVDGIWTKNEKATVERSQHIKQLMDDVWAD